MKEKRKYLTSAKRAREMVLSHATDSHVFFDNIDYGDNLLFLYHDSECPKSFFNRLVKQKEDGLVHYISHEKNRLSYCLACTGHTFKNVDGEKLKQIRQSLGEHFSELEEQHVSGLVLADWSKGDVSDCSLFLPFIKELVGKCQRLSKKSKKQVRLINAFDTSKASSDFISRLISLHKDVFLLQDADSSVLSPVWKRLSPEVRVVAKQVVEKFAKGHQEPLILSLLEKGDKSGYEMLKAIRSWFHSDLSQSTLYRLLTKLEEMQMIVSYSGRGREVIYSLTPKGRLEFQEVKEHYPHAFNHFMAFIASSRGLGEGRDETQMSLARFTAGCQGPEGNE